MVIAARWKLKSCPRCSGDMFQENFQWHCLQCGHSESAETLREKRRRAGRIGGLQKFFRCGSEGMRSMAIKGGGRPRVDLAERLRSVNAVNKKRRIPEGITKLKRHWNTEIKVEANLSAVD